MNLFEEAQRDLLRALALGDLTAASRIAQETMAEAVSMGMDDLTEILQECAERGHYADMQSVLHAMSAKEAGWQADRDSVLIERVKENALSAYMPSMN